jgi:hypothetical protein
VLGDDPEPARTEDWESAPASPTYRSLMGCPRAVPHRAAHMAEVVGHGGARSAEFDSVFTDVGAWVIKTPVRAPRGERVRRTFRRHGAA